MTSIQLHWAEGDVEVSDIDMLEQIKLKAITQLDTIHGDVFCHGVDKLSLQGKIWVCLLNHLLHFLMTKFLNLKIINCTSELCLVGGKHRSKT